MQIRSIEITRIMGEMLPRWSGRSSVPLSVGRLGDCCLTYWDVVTSAQSVYSHHISQCQAYLTRLCPLLYFKVYFHFI